MTPKPSAGIPEDNARELRTWVSKKGTQVRASLVSEKNGELVLKTETGKLVTIAPANLSEADQQYVADVRKQSKQ
jgi:hypothetical protein